MTTTTHTHCKLCTRSKQILISSRCTVDRQHMHAHMHNYLRNFQSLNGNLSIVHVSSHLLTSCYCPFNLFRLQCNNDSIFCTWYEFKRRKATILVPFLMTEGKRERDRNKIIIMKKNNKIIPHSVIVIPTNNNHR